MCYASACFYFFIICLHLFICFVFFFYLAIHETNKRVVSALLNKIERTTPKRQHFPRNVPRLIVAGDWDDS